MADDTYPLESLKLSDDVEYARDGSTTPVRVARFYLGRNGPFTEKFPREQFSDSALQGRIDKLRAELRNIR
jgi:hypothetical protein